MRQWQTRKLLPLFILCMLAACGRGDPPAPQVARAATGVAVFGDSHPHDWVGRAPWHYAVHGVDVSRYQGDIDWSLVRRSNISFAYIKATEGGDRVDDNFSAYWRGAGSAGIQRGAYHFYYFCRPAIEQAQWFIRNVPREKGALPPVLDMEWNNASPTCKLRPDAQTVRSEMKIFLDALERHYGARPVIYTTPDFYEQNIDGYFRNETFWLRTVKAHPRVVYPGRNWTFWQYTGTGVVPGVPGDTDINVFAGSKSDWQQWVAENRI